MTANEGPAPQPTGTGPSESIPAAKRISLTDQRNGQGDSAVIERDDYPRALRRRRAGALRCAPLPDGRRDPLEPETQVIDEAQLDAWARALRHLRDVGLPGLPPADIAAALGRRPERYSDVFPRWPAA